MSGTDVIVGWLQNDYGRLGRPAEALAHALMDAGLARRVAYVEPFTQTGDTDLQMRNVRGVDVFQGTGFAPAGSHQVASAVVSACQMEAPIFLNCGLVAANWWLHYEFAPACAVEVLVAHDRFSVLLPEPQRSHLERVRSMLARGVDAVAGLSHGAIDDIPGAHYVGHGVDAHWAEIDDAALEEPEDLAAIPHPRAIYMGALSLRIDADAIAALAASGVHVVLLGFQPSEAVQTMIDAEPQVHFLGERAMELTPAYLRHVDVGIIPHTDEPFTHSMEPHKAYNYAAGGVRTVVINTTTAPALDAVVSSTTTIPDFVAATHAALEQGRLPASEVARVRAITWGTVAERLLNIALEARDAR